MLQVRDGHALHGSAGSLNEVTIDGGVCMGRWEEMGNGKWEVEAGVL